MPSVGQSSISTMLRIAVGLRHYQKHLHPQVFPQTVQLTDGSTIELTAISPKRPLLVLPVDSINHPSWQGGRRDAGAFGTGRVTIDSHGRLAKFASKFGGMEEAFSLGNDEIEYKMPAAASAKRDAGAKGKSGKRKK